MNSDNIEIGVSTKEGFRRGYIPVMSNERRVAGLACLINMLNILQNVN